MNTKQTLVLVVTLYSVFLFISFTKLCINSNTDGILNPKLNVKNENATTIDTTSSHTYYTNTNITQITEESKDLLDFIYSVNQQQPIQNYNLFDGEIELVILIQVHNRSNYLQELINSLRAAAEINKTLIIFSHDIYDKIVNKVIEKIRFAKIMQIFYPFSIQSHPNMFPGPELQDCQLKDECEQKTCNCSNFYIRDSYGNFRNASLVQIKHHWWWKVNFVFEKVFILKDYKGLILFLEEDHYLAPDFIHCLKLMVKFRNYLCPECWFYALGLHNRFNFYLSWDYVYIQDGIENLGLAFNKTVWREISKNRKHFCKYDDYNWDWSLKHVTIKVVKEDAKTMVLGAARAIHIGSCGAHSADEICNPSDLIEFFKKQQVALFPNSLGALHNDAPDDFSPNGGWGDPRDHAFCLAM